MHLVDEAEDAVLNHPGAAVEEAAAEELPEVEAVSVDAEEVEDVEDLEEEAVEVPEEVALKLSSNPIVTGVSSSPRARKMYLSQRT